MNEISLSVFTDLSYNKTYKIHIVGKNLINVLCSAGFLLFSYKKIQVLLKDFFLSKCFFGRPYLNVEKAEYAYIISKYLFHMH